MLHQQIEPGTKFSSWTVVRHKSGPWYECMCACGTVGTRQAHDLRTGKSKQCKACATSIRSIKHGHSRDSGTSSEYNSYTSMIQRCTNPKAKDYARYGGRGITVCEMWRDSFEAFLLCMGPKPDPSYSIERLDVNKGYEPSNCIWATREVQSRNKTSTQNLTINGVTQCVTEWSKDPGCTVDVSTIHKRLKKGMDPVDAVFKPSGAL